MTRSLLASAAVALAACSGTVGGGGRAGNDQPPTAKGSKTPSAHAPAGAGGDTGADVAPAQMPAAPSRGAGEFACPTTNDTPPPSARIRRLTDVQYRNMMAVLFNGRRSAATPKVVDKSSGLVQQPLSAPDGVLVPLSTAGDVYRFTTYSGTTGISAFEFRRNVQMTEDTARRLVQAAKKGTCWSAAATTPTWDACAGMLIQDKGSILFQRPLTPDEIADYVKMARDNEATIGRDEAMTLVFQSMLLAPQFLFRTEIGEPVPGAKGVGHLTSFEVAAALSFALTDMPADQELWNAAAAGKLASANDIAAQVTRVLAAHSALGPREFVAQYFQIDNLLSSPKQTEESCTYLRTPVLNQARLLIDDILGTNGGKDFWKTILTSSTAFYSCDTAKLYAQKSPPDGTNFVRFSAPPTQRAGLLTNPAFLGAFGSFDENKPVQRGKFVNFSLLCRSIPDAPVGVIPQLPPATAMTQMRDRLTAHDRDPGCATCHSLMDPLGLAFELYDVYGKYRPMDGGRAVDASGMLIGTDVDGPFQDAVGLAQRLASSQQVEQCFVRHGFRYFVGRDEDAFDSCTLQASWQAYAKSGGSLAAMLTAIFTSPSFLERSN